MKHISQMYSSVPSATMRRMAATFATLTLAILTAPSLASAAEWEHRLPPTPVGTQITFSSVSCTPSEAWCSTVGHYFVAGISGKQKPLAEGFSSSTEKWKTQEVPVPAASKNVELYGVSCVSSTSCTAAGNYETTGGTYWPLVEHWNGTAWAIQETPSLTTERGFLRGVSCTSAEACTAVGYQGTAKVKEPLVERWNGTAWKIQTTPSLEGKNVLNSVSCASATFCTAGGEGTAGQPLAEHWNGTTWAVQETPKLKKEGVETGSFNGVSCASTESCTAVGERNGTALNEGWNGTAWTVQEVGLNESILMSVSCPFEKSCRAVGTKKGKMFVQHWNGTFWQIEALPKEPGEINSSLGGVSCTSTTGCMTVGEVTTETGEWSLAYLLK